MMREIKFRLWDVRENKFWENVYRAYEGELKVVSINLNGRLTITDMCGCSDESIPEYRNRFIVNQFTGLLDKNGKEIYEGDIVCDGVDKSSRGKIEWNWGSWVFSDGIQEDIFLGHHNSEIEVIGNVWENPALLKEASKMTRDYEKKIGEEYAEDIAKDKKLTEGELTKELQDTVSKVSKGLMSQRLADRILQPIFTALSLYAEKEAYKKRVDGLITKLNDEIMEAKVSKNGHFAFQVNMRESFIKALEGLLAREGNRTEVKDDKLYNVDTRPCPMERYKQKGGNR
jgi:uncharacterized phage protein (TIGR01671 family)